MKIDLNDHDPKKLKPVKQTEGPVLIIAGPGSCKTRTMVARFKKGIIIRELDPISF